MADDVTRMAAPEAVGTLDPQARRAWTKEERDGALKLVRESLLLARQKCAGGPEALGIDLQRISQYPQERPVFVLGAARSGTTALLRALRDGAGLFAWDEGHLFSSLPVMLAGIRGGWEQYAASKPHPA